VSRASKTSLGQCGSSIAPRSRRQSAVTDRRTRPDNLPASRCAAPVHRRVAVYKSRQRSAAAIFADGITEDLTTDLSRIADTFVISRNTAFTYQGKRVETKQNGRELCVRYVLEGSVRRTGNHIRINAQLIDAETDAHLWAERFDGDTSDLFALQDEVTSRIAISLDVELVAVEAVRQTQNPDAADYILRGRAAELKTPSRDSRAERDWPV
jgi:TolB-like protein